MGGNRTLKGYNQLEKHLLQCSMNYKCQLIIRTKMFILYLFSFESNQWNVLKNVKNKILVTTSCQNNIKEIGFLLNSQRKYIWKYKTKEISNKWQYFSLFFNNCLLNNILVSNSVVLLVVTVDRRKSLHEIT